MSWHPNSQTIKIDDKELHFVQRGDGIPLLLLHGFMHSSYTWRHNVGPLSGDFRVIAPCQLGHGYSQREATDYSIGSMASFIVGLLDTLNVDKTHIIGNSLGGSVALHLAANYPDRIDRLILENPLCMGLPIPNSMLNSMSTDKWGNSYKSLLTSPVFPMILRTRAYKNIKVDEEVLEGFLSPKDKPGSIEAAISVARNMPNGIGKLVQDLDKIHHPALVLLGRKDGILAPKMGKKLASLLPNSWLEILHECGHFPHEENPNRFNLITRGFLLGKAALEKI